MMILIHGMQLNKCFERKVKQKEGTLVYFPIFCMNLLHIFGRFPSLDFRTNVFIILIISIKVNINYQ